MHQFAKRIFVAAAPLLLTGCLWGPGKFASDLTLKKDGSFILDYKGEVVLADAAGRPRRRPIPGTTKWRSCFVGMAESRLDSSGRHGTRSPTPTKDRGHAPPAEIASAEGRA